MKETIIIIPTYNERGNISDLIKQIFEIVPEVKVMVVDDNSPDGTAEAVTALQKIYPNLLLFNRLKKEGLGTACKEAFSKVIKEFPAVETIVTMDADFGHDPKDLPDILENTADFDIVIGSVHLKKEGLDSYPFFRRLLSKWANFYCRKILGYGLTDWTNNFVAIRVSLLKELNLTELGAKEFAFVFSLRFSLLKLGASWKEIPVVIKTRNKGKSKMKFSTMAEAAIVPWKLRLKLK